MDMFEVSPEDIERLNDSDLRNLIGYLAEYELISQGLSPSAVTYGGHQNAKDGGIDVRIETGTQLKAGYIPRPDTGFQVKAEDFPAGEIEKEMRPGGQLREAINDLAQRSGSYIIVSSKGAVSDTALTNRKNAMIRAAACANAANQLHVDFYDRRRVASWVNSNPGLIAWLRTRVGRPITGWRPFGDWSSSPSQENEEYLTDDKLRLICPDSSPDSNGICAVEGIEKVRKILRQRHGLVRLTGLSGVGKTRFVQALFDDRIGKDALTPYSCIYVDISDAPSPQPVELCTWLGDMARPCVIVVDNCGVALHQKLASRLQSINSDISIITVEYDVSDDEPEYTAVFRLEPSSADLIVKLLERKYPQLAYPEVMTIAGFSEGNARIAFALAETSKRGDSLANLKDSDLFRRLFRQNNEDDPHLLKAAKTIALVYSFDLETLDGDEAELPVLAALAGQTVPQLHGHVAELKRRQLVQQRSKWRALLPHALAHRLAKQALQDIPRNLLLENLTERAPERLIRSFSKRLGCLHDAPEAQAIAAGWLSEGGWLGDVSNLNEFGVVLFENIAPVNLDATLDSLERAIAVLSAQEDRERSTDRLTRLLRSLAYEARNFDRALRLIVELAPDAQRTNNTSDAINIFGSLFHLYLSGTQAGPAQRANLLRLFAQSSCAKTRSFAIAGLSAMFECDHFSSYYNFEFGARKRDYGFQPNGRLGIVEWFTIVFTLCREMEAIPPLKQEVRSLFAAEFPRLIQTGMIDELISVALSFNEGGGWPEGWVSARKAARFARKAKRDEDVKKLRKLAAKLEPQNLQHRIVSYVLPEVWGTLDLADIDEFDDLEKIKKAQVIVESVCEDIGYDLTNDHAALKCNFRSIVESRSSRGLIVAKAMGERASDPEAIWRIILSEVLSSKTDRSGAFLAAFVFGVSKKCAALSDKMRNEIFASEHLHGFVIRVETYGPLTNSSVARIKSALDLATVPTESFRQLAYGHVTDDLAAADFKEIVEALAKRQDDGLDVALEIMEMKIHFAQHDGRTLELEHKIAGKDLLWRAELKRKNRRPHSDPIAKIILACLSCEDTEIAVSVSTRLLNALVDHRVSVYNYGELVSALCVKFPRVVLNIFVEGNEATIQTPRSLFRGFREGRACPLDGIDDEVLLAWAREKPETRYNMLAEIVRPWRGQTQDDHYEEPRDVVWTSVARRLLEEAPDPLTVLTSFIDCIQPSGWNGSLADILEGRLPLILELQKDPRPCVAEKATEAAQRLAAAIEANRRSEAQENRAQDEKFDW